MRPHRSHRPSTRAPTFQCPRHAPRLRLRHGLQPQTSTSPSKYGAKARRSARRVRWTRNVHESEAAIAIAHAASRSRAATGAATLPTSTIWPRYTVSEASAPATPAAPAAPAAPRSAPSGSIDRNRPRANRRSQMLSRERSEVGDFAAARDGIAEIYVSIGRRDGARPSDIQTILEQSGFTRGANGLYPRSAAQYFVGVQDRVFGKGGRRAERRSHRRQACICRSQALTARLSAWIRRAHRARIVLARDRGFGSI